MYACQYLIRINAKLQKKLVHSPLTPSRLQTCVGKYGSHSITAVQAMAGTSSRPVTGTFKIVPIAPTIESPRDGQKFAFDKAPKTISGFGVNGATVTVGIAGAKLSAIVDDGTWTVMIPENLKVSKHNVSAVQEIEEAASTQVSIVFTLEAAAKPAPSTAPVAPQGNINGGGGALAKTNTNGGGGALAKTNTDGGALANTGADSVLLFAGTGGAMLAAGASLLFFRRKNTKEHHDS